VKKKPKIPDIGENEWVYPTTKNYKFICCDCGLVHSMDFNVVMLIPTGDKNKNGMEVCTLWRVPQAFSVRMRARRDMKMTKAVRKQRHYEGV